MPSKLLAKVKSKLGGGGGSNSTAAASGRNYVRTGTSLTKLTSSNSSSDLLGPTTTGGIVGRTDCKLVKLIVKQRWNELLILLKRDGEEALSMGYGRGHTSSIVYGGSDYKNGNILHLICMYHPPHRVVHYVASLCPLLAVQVNSLKQTPLHVASAYGANHRVIQSLIRHGGTSPALTQDMKGRTPLHLHLKHCSSPHAANCDMGETENLGGSNTNNPASAADGYSSMGGYKRTVAKNKSSRNVKKESDTAVQLVPGPNVKVLRLLSEAAPQCIHMEDNEGITPMSIANHNHKQHEEECVSSSRITLALQRTADAARRRSSIGFANVVMVRRLSNGGSGGTGGRHVSKTEEVMMEENCATVITNDADKLGISRTSMTVASDVDDLLVA